MFKNKNSLLNFALTFLLIFAGLVTLSGCNHHTEVKDNRPRARVRVWDFWIQAMEDNSATETSMFGEINNIGKYKATIRHVTLDNVEGDTQMIRVDNTVSPAAETVLHYGFQIRPDKTLVLQPEGSHFQLIKLKKPLVDGDTVDVTLEFYGGRIFKVHSVPVKQYP